jgi:glycogen debranching enzyme GlgX
LKAAAPDASRIEAGSPRPLGASVAPGGVNFAIVAGSATAVELCLFGSGAIASQVETRLQLPGRSGDVWHGFVPDAAASLIYGYRAHGPWAPAQGHKFNANKLLLDPYAREIVGRFEWRDEQFGFDVPTGITTLSTQDNGAFALKARVVDDRAAFDWGGDRSPAIAAADTVLYEAHVKGATALHPLVPEAQRGTYAGLVSDAFLAHLKRLGVTSVSLLPVHQHIDEQRLSRMGLRNYWGYNTIGFFVPEPTYAASGVDGARNEFRAMVRTLHAAGIEVILDVVYNHSAETDEFGPTISWRGLDNAAAYRLPSDALCYENQTGCGNTFDIRQPRVLQMVMDSLRYWTEQMHVDGFRFDLAPVLARDGAQGAFDARAAFLKAVAQDPVLQRVKLIAEPWDIGEDGYKLGQFPAGWMEWNDRYRDTLRGFWLAGRDGPPPDAASALGAVATRLCASSDLFEQRGRSPAEGVNFIVAHDGFTLHDLVSYDSKHNQANGENNRDGHGHNMSWNCGVEGPTTDAAVTSLRSRLKRALLSMLLLGQGTPMLCAGDELGHTQDGNNNPYCQDNAITWIDWSRADDSLIAFTAALIRVRRELLPLGSRWNDHLDWLRADGAAMRSADWNDGARTLGCLIASPQRSTRSLLLLINSGVEPVEFALPTGSGWQRVIDSGEAGGMGDDATGSGEASGNGDANIQRKSAPRTGIGADDSLPSTQAYPLGPRSVALLAAV